jgi:hypothetical protein
MTDRRGNGLTFACPMPERIVKDCPTAQVAIGAQLCLMEMQWGAETDG